MVSSASPFSPGLTYMVLSAASFCLMTVFVKLAGNSLPTVQIVFVRGVITLLLTGILIFRDKINPFGNHKKLLAARGITGLTFATFTQAWEIAIHHIQAILHTAPAITAGVSTYQQVFFNSQVLETMPPLHNLNHPHIHQIR